MEVTRVGGENGDNDHHRAVGEIVSQVTTQGDQSESHYTGDKLQQLKTLILQDRCVMSKGRCLMLRGM